MSAGTLFQEALRIVRRLDPPRESERELLAAISAARRDSLTAFWVIGSEAGLPRDVVLRRGTSLLFLYAAGNLADDIADGDCTYLELPTRAGPGAQYLLQNLFVSTAADVVPAPALAHAGRLLSRAAAWHPVEIRTREWTAERYRAVGEAIAGLQWAAYLVIMLAGTRWEAGAEEIGRLAGFAGHVLEDMRSKDRRLSSMSDQERRLIYEQALASARAVQASDLRCLNALGRSTETALLGARSEP